MKWYLIIQLTVRLDFSISIENGISGLVHWIELILYFIYNFEEIYFIFLIKKIYYCWLIIKKLKFFLVLTFAAECIKPIYAPNFSEKSAVTYSRNILPEFLISWIDFKISIFMSYLNFYFIHWIRKILKATQDPLLKIWYQSLESICRCEHMLKIGCFDVLCCFSHLTVSKILL